MRLAELIEQRHEEILLRWEARVRGAVLDGDAPRGVLRDDIPAFLETVAAALRGEQGPGPLVEVAEVHGRERALQGADLRAVVFEYGELREAIFEILREQQVDLELEDLRILGAALTRGVAEAATRVVEHGQRQLREAHDVLEQRVRSFRELADDLPQIAWLAEADGSIYWFNARWYEFTGLSRDESLGCGWLVALDRRSRELAATFLDAARAEEAWEATLTLRGRDARACRFLARAVPVRDAAGRVIHYAGTSTDVEDQAKLAEERQLLFARAPDILCVSTYDGRFVRVNDAFVEKLGWSEEELLGHALFEFVHPDDRARTRDELGRLAQGFSTFHFENRFRTRGGAYRTIAWAANPSPEQGYVYGSARDVTEQRRGEKEREEALALVDTLLTSAPVGIAFLDPEFRYVQINRTLADINRAPVAAHIGRTLREMRPDLGPMLEPVLRQVIATGEAIRQFELTERRRDHFGTAHRLVSVYPVRDAAGRIFALGVLVVDITRRKQQEEALQRTAEFRERFLGIVAHDLRTPLASIATAAQLLERKGTLPPEQLRLAQRVASTSRRMAGMIGALMDFTRARLGGGIPVEPRWTRLGDVVRPVVEEIEAAFPGRTVELALEDEPNGEWDPDRLAQVFGNLLTNALSYSPSDTPIEVRVRQVGDMARFEVSNRNEHGPIPPELLDDIFNPFRRTEQSRGLGLGLYVAHEIVESHGGTIDVRSDERGTTFTVTLPADSPAGPDMDERAAEVATGPPPLHPQ